MKRLLWILALLTTFITTPAYAEISFPQDIVHDQVDVGEAISPMKIDQRTPFSGVLLSPKALAKVVAELRAIDEKVNLSVKHAVEIETAKCETAIKNKDQNNIANAKVAEERLNLSLNENQILTERLKKLENETDYTWLYITGGAVTGMAMTILSVWATK